MYIFSKGKLKKEREKRMSKEQKELLKGMFRGYKHITPAMIRCMNDIGLVVIRQSGKHMVFRREDNIGGSITIAKTPSDTRSGMNVVRYIFKLAEMV